MDALLVVHMKGRVEGEPFQNGDRNINETHPQVVNKNVPAASLALFPVTHPCLVAGCSCLVKGAYIVFSLSDFETIRRPEGEGVNGTC